jgi:hypothetical protein
VIFISRYSGLQQNRSFGNDTLPMGGAMPRQQRLRFDNKDRQVSPQMPSKKVPGDRHWSTDTLHYRNDDYGLRAFYL